MRILAALLTVVAAGLSLSPTTEHLQPTGSTKTIPPLMLWAWERPTDLRGLRTGTGVALLAQTVRAGFGEFVINTRRQPLQVDPVTPLVAVTRLETVGTPPATLTDTELSEIADRIAATAEWPQVVAVQIDFDAVASERPLYRRLLRTVRQRLPAPIPLSITALASWCAGDRWLDDLPINEAVPMLFEMGDADGEYASIAQSPESAARVCRGALGLSLAEPLSFGRDTRRVYVFNPESWSARDVATAAALGR